MPQELGEQRNLHGRHVVDLEHGDGLRVIGHQQGSALARPQPQVLPAKRKLDVIQSQSDRTLDQTEPVDRRRTIRERSYDAVFDGDGLEDARRIRDHTGSMPILSLERKRKRSGHRARTKAGYVVRAFGIWPSVIVDDRLREVVAIAERGSRNAGEARVDGIRVQAKVRRTVQAARLVAKFSLQGGIDLLRFSFASCSTLL